MNKKGDIKVNDISETHWWYQARNNVINKVLAIHFKGRNQQDNKILDIGCGMGQLFPIWQKYGKIFGVEKNKDSVSVVKLKYPQTTIWIDGFPDEYSLKFKYDLICMCDFLEHVQDPEMVLKEVRKRLNSGGLLLITVPAYKWLWSDYDVKAGHKKRYTNKELKEELDNNGFRVIYLSYFMFLLFPLAFLVRKLWCFKNKDNIANKDLEYGSKGFLNKFLFYLFSIEKLFIGRCSIPFGLSILGLFETKC